MQKLILAPSTTGHTVTSVPFTYAVKTVSCISNAPPLADSLPTNDYFQ